VKRYLFQLIGLLALSCAYSEALAAPAQQKAIPTARATPTATPTPRPVAPPPPIACAHKSRSGFASVEAHNGDVSAACVAARKELDSHTLPDCDPPCISVGTRVETAGSSTKLTERLANAFLNLFIGDECRITEIRLCQPPATPRQGAPAQPRR
jgi:hypothetical protein